MTRFCSDLTFRSRKFKGFEMNSISIFEGKSLVIEGVENWSKAYDMLSDTIKACYVAWKKHSNCDGKNSSMRIDFDGFTYIFCNHYWD